MTISTTIYKLIITCLLPLLFINNASATVYMANGIKIGETTDTTTIIWARLTQKAELNRQGIQWQEKPQIPNGKSLEQMKDVVMGKAGKIQIHWYLNDKRVNQTKWLNVDPLKDFTLQVPLSHLLPNSHYTVEVLSKDLSGNKGQTTHGSFRTAPSKNQITPVHFTVVSCQEFSRRDDAFNGHKIYPHMQKLNPDFFVHTGDVVYYDFKRALPKATDQSLARFKWNRMYAQPYQRNFHNNTSSYFMKDDHDTLKNDAAPGHRYGDLTWEQGINIFKEQVPMGESTYRTVRWGKDLQVWFVEGRDFRSKNKSPDGPNKTIWGTEQKKWFFESVKKSDATFRLLISPTPIVGPDRENKHDNHANVDFTFEGNEIRQFISEQKNMLVITGDRHWQYISEDPKTKIREYSSGATSDEHAGGYSEKLKTPMHKYLKVKGGFLSVNVERKNNQAQAVMTHYGVDGQIYNQDIITAK